MTKKWLFLALTFGVDYLLALVYFALGGKLASTLGFAVISVYMFTPMLVAIVVQKAIYKEALRKPFEIFFKPNRWFVAAWLLPPAIAFATLGVSLLLPGVAFAPDMEGMFERFKSMLTPEQIAQIKEQAAALPIHPIWLGLIQGLIAGPTINAVFGFGEELGWRGLLQKEFGYMGFWKSSAWVGVIWGVWHAPIILQGYNYPEHPTLGVAMMTIFTLLLAPIFAYIRTKAKSVIAAAILHGSMNATFGLSLIIVKGGGDLIVGVTGLAGFIALVLTNIVLWIYDSRLAKESIMV